MAFFAVQESYAATNIKGIEPYAELIYTVNVGTEKYLIHFNVCAGQKTIEFPEILIKSSKEALEIRSTKSIYPYTCRSYESMIHAKYPTIIKIILL